MENRSVLSDETRNEWQVGREAERSIDKKAVDIYLEHVLASYQRIDEGQDGVIGTIDITDIEPNILSILMKHRTQEFDLEALALKLLKIYSGKGASKQEAEVQQKAFAILHEAGAVDSSIARVPEIYFADELEVHEESTVERLQMQGVTVGEDKKVEVLLMDYVPGCNFATYLFKEVAKRHPDLFSLYQDFENEAEVSFNQVVDQIATALKVKADSGDLLTATYQAIADYLYSEGFVLDPAFLESIKKATDTLHANGVYHNDLHERNVVVQPDKSTGSITKSFIIDFGRGTAKGEVDVAQRVEKGLKDDNYINNLYRKLTRSEAQRKETQAKDMYGSMVLSIEKKFSTQYKECINVIDALVEERGSDVAFNEIVQLVNAFIKDELHLNQFAQSEEYWSADAYLLQQISDRHEFLKDQVLEYLENAFATDKTIANSLPARNRLRRIVQTIKMNNKKT